MNSTAYDQRSTSLAELDRRIAESPRGPLTLAPDRERATSLVTLVDLLADPHERPYLATLAAAVAGAQLDSFPENLFWDFDFYLASAHLQAREAPDYARHVDELLDITVRLMRMYGHDSKIRFRYVHDFIYGFDWARWVRRAPHARTGVDPFSIEFLMQSERRGLDILGLIEADDSHYPKLSGTAPRNPFPFLREPEDELRLYRELVAQDAVPVCAWKIDARPDASRNFDELREAAASSLGLGR